MKRQACCVKLCASGVAHIRAFDNRSINGLSAELRRQTIRRVASEVPAKMPVSCRCSNKVLPVRSMCTVVLIDRQGPDFSQQPRPTVGPPRSNASDGLTLGTRLENEPSIEDGGCDTSGAQPSVALFWLIRRYYRASCMHSARDNPLDKGRDPSKHA